MSPEKNSKPAQRIQAFSRRANIDKDHKISAANDAAIIFLKNISLNDESVIAFYLPIKNELDCIPLVMKLDEKGFKLCLPVIVEKEKPMVFREWEEGHELIKDIAGISCPNPSFKEVKPDYILMPLVAFDKNANRLGFGNGYYDRSIAKMKTKPILVGYGFSVQEVDNINNEDHDIPLDFMVTEKEFLQFNKDV